MFTGKSAHENIDRRDTLSYPIFARDYLRPNIPVVITDALREWKAVSQWTPEFLNKEYGHLEWRLNEETHTMADLVDRVMTSTEENPAPYLHGIKLEDYFSNHLSDLSPAPSYWFPNWLESRLVPSGVGGPYFYFGGEGGSFPVLHFDTQHTHAFLCQLHGQKEYIVYHPDETDNLYPQEDPVKRNVSRVDVWNPDLGKFPLFAKAKQIRFRLSPGEMLFIPAGWWHTVRILSPSITVSMSVVNASNWNDYSLDVCYRSKRINPLLSVPVHLAMMGVGLLQSVKDALKPGP